MPGFIRTIIAATLFQVAVMVGLTVYMNNHADNVSLQYARMTLESAKAYAEQKDLELYNRIQQDQSRDRAELELWLSRQIDLKLLKQGTHN
ncbi:hypothetical protein [Pseudomonas syringae]|uniref:Uncharacterized protein n=1 Tax=Pseudomonas syringae TaxID=317 RepID=A0A085VHT8_PSESX|nr:hypothetical protein [Pseudomonas syringae]KFE55001.1 hypothetical protein IV02_02980 [Pseudomonas syringae]